MKAGAVRRLETKVTVMRFTVRRLMIAVAIIAILLGAGDWGVRLNNRRIKGRRIVEWCFDQEFSHRGLAKHYDLETGGHRKSAEEWRSKAQNAENPALRRIREGAAEDCDQRAEYWSGLAKQQHEEAEVYARMRRTFERAASHPWEALPPAPQDSPYAEDQPDPSEPDAVAHS
jgi:hypothetical protein